MEISGTEFDPKYSIDWLIEDFEEEGDLSPESGERATYDSLLARRERLITGEDTLNEIDVPES